MKAQTDHALNVTIIEDSKVEEEHETEKQMFLSLLLFSLFLFAFFICYAKLNKKWDRE